MHHRWKRPAAVVTVAVVVPTVVFAALGLFTGQPIDLPAVDVGDALNVISQLTNHQVTGGLVVLAVGALAGVAYKKLHRSSMPAPTAISAPRPDPEPIPTQDAPTPYFLPRPELAEIHQGFTGPNPVQAQAISGFAGLGKTQLALAYRAKHTAAYPDTKTFWLDASSEAVLDAAIRQQAEDLGLRPTDAADAWDGFTRWLRKNTGWLLVADNVQSFADLTRLLAPGGHLLATTQPRDTGGWVRHELHPLTEDEGALLVLRRAGILPRDAALEQAGAASLDSARELAGPKGFAGHPLALDQAGAYAMETGCSVAELLRLLREEARKLLAARGANPTGHPFSVEESFALNFVRLSPDARRLVETLAFLAPSPLPRDAADAIAAAGTPKADVNALRGELLRYSLVDSNRQTGALTMHQVVQTVAREQLDDAAQRARRAAAIEALNAVFPEGRFGSWPQCAALIAHVQAVVGEQGQLVATFTRLSRWQALVTRLPRAVTRRPDQRAAALAGASLCDRLATYLQNALANYPKAEPLYRGGWRCTRRRWGRSILTWPIPSMT